MPRVAACWVLNGKRKSTSNWASRGSSYLLDYRNSKPSLKNYFKLRRWFGRTRGTNPTIGQIILIIADPDGERRHTTPASVFCLHWTKSNPCSSKAAVIRREGLMDFSLEASHGNFRHGASVGSIGGKLRLLVLHDFTVLESEHQRVVKPLRGS